MSLRAARRPDIEFMLTHSCPAQNSCFTSSFAKSGCRISDVRCACSNNIAILSDSATCIAGNTCSPDDALAAFEAFNDGCRINISSGASTLSATATLGSRPPPTQTGTGFSYSFPSPTDDLTIAVSGGGGGGLSPGAAAGIGVGVAAAVALGAFFVWRTWRKRRTEQPGQQVQQPVQHGHAVPGQIQLPPGYNIIGQHTVPIQGQ